MRELQLDAENHHQLAYFRMLINLLTATAQNEIKKSDLRYRPQVDSVIPRYMTILSYRGI